jgi:hypothetical protein
VDGSDQKAIRRNEIGVHTQGDLVRDRKTKMAIVYLRVVFSFKPTCKNNLICICMYAFMVPNVKLI